jgi:hypothetical protein
LVHIEVNKTDPQTFRLDLINGLSDRGRGEWCSGVLIQCMGISLLNHPLEDWTLLPGNDSCHKIEI